MALLQFWLHLELNRMLRGVYTRPGAAEHDDLLLPHPRSLCRADLARIRASPDEWTVAAKLDGVRALLVSCVFMRRRVVCAVGRRLDVTVLADGASGGANGASSGANGASSVASGASGASVASGANDANGASGASSDQNGASGASSDPNGASSDANGANGASGPHGANDANGADDADGLVVVVDAELADSAYFVHDVFVVARASDIARRSHAVRMAAIPGAIAALGALGVAVHAKPFVPMHRIAEASSAGPCDGLVLANATAPAVFGSGEALLKWKPVSHCTVDLLVERRRCGAYLSRRASARTKNGRKPLFDLELSDVPGPLPCVWEFRHDGASWRPFKPRRDKNTANSEYVVAQTALNIAERIELDELRFAVVVAS